MCPRDKSRRRCAAPAALRLQLGASSRRAAPDWGPGCDVLSLGLTRASHARCSVVLSASLRTLTRASQARCYVPPLRTRTRHQPGGSPPAAVTEQPLRLRQDTARRQRARNMRQVDMGPCSPIPQPPALRAVAMRHSGAPVQVDQWKIQGRSHDQPGQHSPRCPHQVRDRARNQEIARER